MLTIAIAAALAAMSVADEGLPLSLQDPAPQNPPPAPAPAQPEPSGDGHKFLDFDQADLNLWVGLAMAGGDFESDPQFAAGATLRVASPWLSRGLLGLDHDALGLFIQFAGSKVDRDIEPLPPNPDGTIMLFAGGLDYTLVNSESWLLAAQVGVQYVVFDDVFEAEDGAGFLIGALGGLRLSDSIAITANPQISFGGDSTFLFTVGLGLLISF